MNFDFEILYLVNFLSPVWQFGRLFLIFKQFNWYFSFFMKTDLAYIKRWKIWDDNLFSWEKHFLWKMFFQINYFLLAILGFFFLEALRTSLKYVPRDRRPYSGSLPWDMRPHRPQNIRPKTYDHKMPRNILNVTRSMGCALLRPASGFVASTSDQLASENLAEIQMRLQGINGSLWSTTLIWLLYIYTSYNNNPRNARFCLIDSDILSQPQNAAVIHLERLVSLLRPKIWVIFVQRAVQAAWFYSAS